MVFYFNQKQDQLNNLVLNSSRKDTARTLLDAGDKILLEESLMVNLQEVKT